MSCSSVKAQRVTGSLASRRLVKRSLVAESLCFIRLSDCALLNAWNCFCALYIALRRSRSSLSFKIQACSRPGLRKRISQHQDPTSTNKVNSPKSLRDEYRHISILLALYNIPVEINLHIVVICE